LIVPTLLRGNAAGTLRRPLVRRRRHKQGEYPLVLVHFFHSLVTGTLERPNGVPTLEHGNNPPNPGSLQFPAQPPSLAKIKKGDDPLFLVFPPQKRSSSFQGKPRSFPRSRAGTRPGRSGVHSSDAVGDDINMGSRPFLGSRFLLVGMPPADRMPGKQKKTLSVEPAGVNKEP
jgi:hypothetical protein